MIKPYENFDHKHYDWQAGVDYKKQPDLYRVGRGEQGVLICEPYKSEMLRLWRFKTPELAIESSNAIYHKFLDYLKVDDFVGADMARKFLQMGFTRARRYANYKGGRKYDKDSGQLLEKGAGDSQKAQSAAIFYTCWQRAEAHPLYAKLKQEWKQKYG